MSLLAIRAVLPVVQIVACSWDGLLGVLTPFQSVSTLPDRVKPCRAHHSGSAHIRVSRNGRAVYATTRTDGGAVVLQERMAPPCLFRQRLCFHVDRCPAMAGGRDG